MTYHSKYGKNFNPAAIDSYELTTLISKQFHASKGFCINKTFILYTIHRHEIHEKSIFPRFLIFGFNFRLDSLYLTDWGKLFQ